jgi:hypothetical protein
MTQPKRHDRPVPTHQCPVCHYPQTKIQRLLADRSHAGSTNYVCTRAGQCSVGIDLGKVSTWAAV